MNQPLSPHPIEWLHELASSTDFLAEEASEILVEAKSSNITTMVIVSMGLDHNAELSELAKMAAKRGRYIVAMLEGDDLVGFESTDDMADFIASERAERFAG